MASYQGVVAHKADIPWPAYAGLAALVGALVVAAWEAPRLDADNLVDHEDVEVECAELVEVVLALAYPSQLRFGAAGRRGWVHMSHESTERVL